jgi:hypothetical protein
MVAFLGSKVEGRKVCGGASSHPRPTASAGQIIARRPAYALARGVENKGDPQHATTSGAGSSGFVAVITTIAGHDRDIGPGPTVYYHAEIGRLREVARWAATKIQCGELFAISLGLSANFPHHFPITTKCYRLSSRFRTIEAASGVANVSSRYASAREGPSQMTRPRAHL